MEHVCMVIDESGSMDAMASVVYGGAREIATGLVDGGTCCVVRFNSDVTIDVDVDRDEATTRLETRHCQGGTALYDAICDGIEHTVRDHGEKTSVAIVVVTDGLENSSHRNGLAQVREAVALATAKGWRVSFLGANQDAVLTASNLGISANWALTYSHDGRGARNAFRSLFAANTRSFRNEGVDGFTQLERQASMHGHPASSRLEKSPTRAPLLRRTVSHKGFVAPPASPVVSPADATAGDATRGPSCCSRQSV